MFFWKKKKNPNAERRELLFGDLPYERWENHRSVSPYKEFLAAKECIDQQDREGAIELLKQALKQEDLEPRHYLQIYHYLRPLGVEPEEKQLYGVVVEVSMGRAKTDLLAAYSDLSARYYNFSGSGVIWDHPDDSLDAEIKDLLEKGEVLMNVLNPWDKERPDIPPRHTTRLNLLTSKGLHYGEGSFDAMSKDALGGPILESAMVLMQALMKQV